MIRYFFICTCILLCSGCCNKKLCPGDALPRIAVKIPGTLQNDETVTLYTLDMGKVDSAFFEVSSYSPFFLFFPMNDFDDTRVGLREFVIRYKNKVDTISHVAAVFREVEIVCDSRWGCGRGTGTKAKIHKLLHFSFQHRGQTHALNDTIVLN